MTDVKPILKHTITSKVTLIMKNARERRRLYYLTHRARALELAKQYYQTHKLQVQRNSKRRYHRLRVAYEVCSKLGAVQR